MTLTQAFVGRSSNVDNDRDTWTTPLVIARAIGRVWLDPCTNPRSLIDAERTFMLDRGQDGLKLARYVPRMPPAPVFVNPPYSRHQVVRWVNAYKHTRFLFLLRFDPSTEWFRILTKASSAILLPFERVSFDPPPGIEREDETGNPYPHAIYARDIADISPSLRAIGTVLRTERPQ